MSSYATLSDLTTLGVPAAAIGGIATSDQQKALDAASDYADGYLRTHYVLPLVSWSRDLTQAVCSIAAYNLLVTRGYNPDDGPDTELRDRFKDAVSWLESVAGDKVSPNLVDSSVASASGGPFTAQAVVDQNTGLVTVGRPKLRGW